MPDAKPSNSKSLEWTFDTVASTYEKLRPGYPTELYQMIFEYLPVDASSHVVEIGIGGAQATLPILQTGCRLTAVEYGEHFSRMCREKFRDYPGFSVVTGKFEDVPFKPDAYDLIFSASAFHWIPEEAGYRKVFSMLKSGGAFARFANHPYMDKGRPELWEDIQSLYRIYMNSTKAPVEYGEEAAKERAAIADRYGFADTRYALFRRTRTFSSGEYTRLLGTYSDHIALEERKRTEFFSRIEQVIDRHGGEITLYDTIDLQLARKP